ncbi:protein, SNF2 family [Opisthorchis viverrini]|uniref:Protein, SNF2 family n=1 Tax=Opisthorchis viverrini TaxID=6198 RepID=A0A1S8X1G5_OPIVI|nr:protein, SNF2 family [Opisthorchis viverrini]
MESHRLQACGTESSSFLQELSEPSGCSYISSPHIQPTAYPDSGFLTPAVLCPEDNPSTMPSSLPDPKSHCMSSPSYPPSTGPAWNFAQSRVNPYVSSALPQRNNPCWTGTAGYSQVYHPSSPCPPYGDFPQKSTHLQLAPPVSRPYGSDGAAPTADGRSRVADRMTPCVNEKPQVVVRQSNSAYGSVPGGDHKIVFSTQDTHSQRLTDGQSFPAYTSEDEATRIHERLSFIHQSSTLSAAAQQESQFLRERLKVLGANKSSTAYANPINNPGGHSGAPLGSHMYPFPAFETAPTHPNRSSPPPVTCAEHLVRQVEQNQAFSSASQSFPSSDTHKPPTHTLVDNGLACVNMPQACYGPPAFIDVNVSKAGTCAEQTSTYVEADGTQSLPIGAQMRDHPMPIQEVPVGGTCQKLQETSISNPVISTIPPSMLNCDLQKCTSGHSMNDSLPPKPHRPSLASFTHSTCPSTPGATVPISPAPSPAVFTHTLHDGSSPTAVPSVGRDPVPIHSFSTSDNPPLVPSACVSQSPVLSGRSTLHYRQSSSTQQPSHFAAPFTSTSADCNITPSQLRNGSGLQNAQSPYHSSRHPFLGHQMSPIDSPAAAYQYNKYQPHYSSTASTGLYSSATGYIDQHLQPISAIPPNTVVPAQCGPTSARFEGDRCNGTVALDLPPSYPPILPKTSPSPTKRDHNSSRKDSPLDRQARNERRRQQRLRKKQAEAATYSSDVPDTETAIGTDSAVSRALNSPKPPRARPRKVARNASGADLTDVDAAVIVKSDAVTLPGDETPVEEDPSKTPPSRSKKRKSSARTIQPRQQQKNAPKLEGIAQNATDAPPNLNESLDSTRDLSPTNESTSEVPVSSELTKQPKVIRTRPPRPKKRKPLPTLIRKKKRSNFYGDESDSEPDISVRLGGSGRGLDGKTDLSANTDHLSMGQKRRSERHTGDRKRYTVDLELNLSDDDSDGDGDLATLNASGATAMVEENEIKIVESVLGRRTTKRVVKKVTTLPSNSNGDALSPSNQTDHKTLPLDQSKVDVEEEEEEDVEEFYLKYKGYSYLHCEWRALDEIDDPRIRPKLRRFEMKQAHAVQQEDDDVVLFNPDYVEVERVLDMKVYRNGQLVCSDQLRQEVERESISDLVEMRRQRKRERERNRARALREAKAKAKLQLEAASSNQPLSSRSNGLAEESIGSVDLSGPGEQKVLGVLSEASVASVDDEKEQTPSRASSEERTSLPEPTVLQNETSTNAPDSVGSSQPSDSTIVGDNVPSDFTAKSDEVTLTNVTSSPNTTLPELKNEEEECSEQGDGERSPVTVTYYLVKWRSLAYEDATWELAQDVDPAKVKEFIKWRTPPKIAPTARDSDYKIIRPDPSTWRPIEAVKVYKNNNKLRDYQLEGVNWLTYCWFHHRNCILADEMGLGKTVQSVAFLLELEKAGVRGPFLVIVPLSTVANWQREFENWSDFNVVVYHGSSISRNMIQEYEIFYKRRPNDTAVRHDVYKFHALVTTFEVLMTDIEFFGQVHWAAAVIDEAHRLKNKKCKLGEGLRYLELDHRVLLTGTPLQNNVEELFGLLNFLEPERFNCSSSFVAEYGDLKTEEQVENLKTLLKPMMLRRLKEDVEKSLAPKEETIVEASFLFYFLVSRLLFLIPISLLSECTYCNVIRPKWRLTEASMWSMCVVLKTQHMLTTRFPRSLCVAERTIIVELTNIQKKYYRAIMERNFAFLCKGSTYSNAPNLMNVMMELRKCCNHPFLIKGAEEAILEEMRTQEASSFTFWLRKLISDQPVSEESTTFHALVYASGKLVLIHKLLPKLRANGHKVLIFSQMIRVLDILEDFLIHQRYPFERIDGRIHGPLRQEAIDRFTADPDKFVFLLCTKAGGLGINLTAADVVIIYDSDWNPQNDLQAQARCHRIGQQKMVKVYRLITRNTYEREMFDRASLKLGLDRAVLQSMGSKEARQAQMSKKEIEELLKKGAYGALMDDDKAGEDFCEEDIDQILQSRSRVVQLEQGEKNSTFSKATFSISDNRSDIELDDPNFWQKWAKKAGVDENAGTVKDLIMKTPRQRRQTSRYSALSESAPVAASPPSYGTSEPEDSATAQSSADENTISGGGSGSGRGRWRRCRRQKRHSKISRNLSSGRRDSVASMSGDFHGVDVTDSMKIEPLDRADLFRVERCLLTWPWGRWERGLSTVPFKRQLEPTELAYFASAVLAFAFKFLPPAADTRIRATIVELTRPKVWNFGIIELAKIVAKATKRASRGYRILDPARGDSFTKEASECNLAPSGSCILDNAADSPSTIDAPATPSLSHGCLAEIVDSVTASETEFKSEESRKEPPAEVEAPFEQKTELIPERHSRSPSCADGDSDKEMDSVQPLRIQADECVDSEKDGKDNERDAAEKIVDASSECATTAKTPNIQNDSPKTASFDPDVLVSCDSFRKHLRRHSVRLMNRVAFLFFLQCEVIGVDSSTELMAGRLAHTDFAELAASLPPLEAIDSELPTAWWDSCCDKCLLLGILKHGWEKYTLMRLDPDLCFYSRAMTRLNELEAAEATNTDVKMEVDKSKTSPSLPSPALVEKVQSLAEMAPHKSDDEATSEARLDEDTCKESEGTKAVKPEDGLASDELEENKAKAKFHLTPPGSPADDCVDEQSKVTKEDEEDEDAAVGASSEALLTALPFPAVADLNSRARKLVSFFVRIKNQLEFDTYRQLPTDEEEESPTQTPNIRLMENRTIKWTRREEADFYRVVSSFGVEFTQIPLSDSDNPEGAVPPPVKRRYNWYNFRQLANITRKNDDALTEYFQAFYRMCQRVCKKVPTEFVAPMSTAATTTTYGSSPLGSEVPVAPISEERATRCLSRIDLLARIRNDILPLPHLKDRLKICQRSSEIPSWWIPGKHDGELMRAVAKHGLARTDLNILSDPEFSFSRILTLIRERLSRDSAVTEYTGDLAANTTRPNLVAAAAAAAKAVVAELENEDKPMVTNDSSSVVTQSDVKSEAALMEVDNSAASTGSNDLKKSDSDVIVNEDKTAQSVEDGTVNDSSSSASPKNTQSVGKAEALPNTAEENSTQDLTTGSTLPKTSAEAVCPPSSVSVNAPCEDILKLNQMGELVPSEWTVKYATNLATAWPKDRTLQHRLELVCQAIEKNEWPYPRRYFPTPSAASLPIPEPNRALNETKILNLSASYASIRPPLATASSFPIPLSLPGKLQSTYGLLQAGGIHLPNVPRPLPVDSPKSLGSFAGTFIRSPPAVAEDSTTITSDTSLDDSECLDSLRPLNLAKSSGPKFNQASSSSSVSVSNLTGCVDEFRRQRSQATYGSINSPTSSSLVPTNSTIVPTTRGRGRGRGRGSRGTRSLGARERLHSALKYDTELRASSDQSLSDFERPTRTAGTDDQSRPDDDSLTQSSGEHFLSDRSSTQSMPPPNSAPRGGPGSRGRKRKLESPRSSLDFSNTPGHKSTSVHAKRERIDSFGSGLSGRGSKSSARTASATTSSSDVWDVRVPVISLVDGSLIYGDKAPKRRALEAWLEMNPNYMPYSVEMEDRIIYNRVAGARGQDTSNMEALAYKHYLNSLIANAAAGLHSATTSPFVASKGSSAPAQQLLQLQQQQQLLQAFGAYARHPAYASILASALSGWQTANLPGIPTFSDNVSEASDTTAISSSRVSSASSTSVSTRTRAAAAKTQDSPAGRRDKSPSSETSTHAASTSGSCSQPASPPESGAPISSVSSGGMDSVLSAAYKQATANLAYMCNPLAAAATYSQLMLSSAGSSMASDRDSTGSSNSTANLSGQQAALASLYATYMLSVQQQQQQQIKQSITWDAQRQQQQQLASLATVLSAACAGTGGLDPSSLMSVFGAMGIRSESVELSYQTPPTSSPHTSLAQSSDTTAAMNLATSTCAPEHAAPNSPDPPHDRKDSGNSAHSEDSDQTQSVLDLST